MFYQSSVIKKYLAMLDNEQVNTAWEVYKSYFLNPEIQENIRSMKEEQFQEGFLRELFVKVFGYTLQPSPNYNLITEKKNETDAKKADGAIIRDEKVIGIIELKDHKTTDLKHVEPQAFGYKNQHRDAHYVIISNFEKLRFYIDNAVDCLEWNLFSLTAEQFRTLYFCLSWANISIDLPLNVKLESVSNEDKITQQLYKDYSSFKREIFADILANNTDSDTPKEHILLLFKKTQKLLDRLLFIFFAEDSGLLPPNSMILILEDWQKLKEMDEYRPLYSRIRKYFGYLDTGFQGKKYEIFAYNGGLFKPDEVLDSLKISDDLLANFTRKLADYDYSTEVDVNILGHIFENSLNEIEEVTAQINAGEAPTVSKRKRDGVFYTPQYITKYIVENTVGRLCAEKKVEMGIDEAEYFADKNRQMATKKRLLDNLDAYREWLKEITICDPACGSGAFLNAALRFLMDEHQLLDEMEKKLTGSDIQFQSVENYILEKNLYGVDINEESVEIARLALWLRTAKPHRKLNSLNNNIKCGNSLISAPEIAGEKAFDWEKEFPQVFARGGFDVVIGNPPYGAELSEADQRYLESVYHLKSTDTACLFMGLALNIAKDKAPISYIIPKPFLYASTWKTTRNVYLPIIRSIVDCSKVWSEVKLEQIIFNAQKGINTEQYISLTRKNTDFDVVANIDKRLCHSFGFYLNGVSDFEIEIAQKMLSCGTTVKDFATNQRGALYQKYITDEPSEYIVYGGKQIGRYINKEAKGYLPAKCAIDAKGYIKPNSVLAQNIIAFIENPYPHIKIIANICDENNAVIVDTINQLCINEPNSNRYILALLNSKLISWYVYHFIFGLAIRTMHFDNGVTDRIPIPECADQQPFIDLADKMLSLNKDLQAKRARFIRRLQDNMPDIKITGTLETFDSLDFAGFVAELKKQKIALSLVQQDDWEEYFGKYKAECRELVEQISATDKEIDARVYALYGLTEEEIKVVEG